MAPPERRLSAEATPFAPPTPLAKVVSRDDDEQTPSPRRRGVIVDNLKVSYGFVRLDDDATAQDLFLHLTDCAYDEPRAGDRVSLVVATYNNKPKAVDVQLIARLPQGMTAPKIKAENERHASRFPVPLREQVACALFAWVAWPPAAGVPPRCQLDTESELEVAAFFAATPQVANAVDACGVNRARAIRLATKTSGASGFGAFRLELQGPPDDVLRAPATFVRLVSQAVPSTKLRRKSERQAAAMAARAAAVASGDVQPPGPWQQAEARADAPPVAAEEVKAAPPVVLEPRPPVAVEPRHTLGREARLRRERAISLAADAGAPAIVTPMAEEGVAPAPASLEAAAPMPAPPATEDETVVGSESDLELDLECSVCAEPFDVKERAPMVLPCSGSHEICALCVVALRDRFGGDDGAFHCPSCREPILPCFPINKNRGLMAALRLNERLARRRR